MTKCPSCKITPNIYNPVFFLIQTVLKMVDIKSAALIKKIEAFVLIIVQGATPVVPVVQVAIIQGLMF